MVLKTSIASSLLYTMQLYLVSWILYGQSLASRPSRWSKTIQIIISGYMNHWTITIATGSKISNFGVSWETYCVVTPKWLPSEPIKNQESTSHPIKVLEYVTAP
jgi:hypothetical protein